MKLDNPFPLEVRSLFMYCYKCWICEENGQRCGGLELHHIWGRVSGSAFNAAVLCKRCHEHVKHNQEEHLKLFRRTVQFLSAESEYTGFKPGLLDDAFFRYVWNDIRHVDFSTV